ncbi:cobalamin biosynthesis protein CbiG [compost metagenome]
MCAKYEWELALYSPEQLNTVMLEQPSETVFKATGAYGVCEPAALLSSGARTLVLKKKKSGNATIAVARVRFDEAEEEE